MQQRGNGYATYRNTDFFGLVDGLNFAVQYRGKNGSVSGEGMTNNGRGALRQNGDGVGGSITYDYEGFGIGAAVSSSKRTDDQNFGLNGYGERYLGNGDRAETYTGGLKYDANNIYGCSVHPDLQRNSRRFPRVGRTKHRTSKLLLSTSSTSVCVHL